MARVRAAAAAVAAVAALSVVCGGGSLATAPGAAAVTARPGATQGIQSAQSIQSAEPGGAGAVRGGAGAAQVRELPPELEKVRAREAAELYGDPAVRPMAERRTSLITLGDSEISGEGVGTYEPGTDGPDNWCHRSPDAAVHRTGIPVQETYNVACSGANSENIRIGGTPQYDDELVQSDSLAIKARNTRLQQVVLVAGANDDLQFGPVMTDCVTRWFLLQGACAPKYEPGWQQRVDGLVPKVEQTVNDLKSVMRDAGYADDDYQLVVMGYPSPIGPDVEDNPDYPGKIVGGCTGYTSDSRWGRDAAVPAFERGMRTVAARTGADYLDASRLFHGHEVCMENPWARGLYVELSNPFPPDENSVRQSFHPNKRGHGAFAACLTQLYEATEAGRAERAGQGERAGQDGGGVREASCADPAGKGEPRLYELAWDDAFAPLHNTGTGSCLGARDGSTGNGTGVDGQDCAAGSTGADGARGQTWWHDPDSRAVYTGLTHDRCLDVPGGDAEPGTELVLWNCSGESHQQFLREDGTLQPVSAPGLCLTLADAHGQVRLEKCTGAANQHFA